ncbi:hypothetical protein CLV85_1298 [Salinibacterium amurskyense]|uniref:Uncharacterized protein n=1 Tax=Salinibacterium amurskyense TaxID=205941 RepID=A0A2M9D8Z5_9MICO|nr:hypothetical protein [Salinibacterium amurskyense]PJJ82108.1 hypothetical protein CLV85_1298 [Salinibacterium amurskyense]
MSQPPKGRHSSDSPPALQKVKSPMLREPTHVFYSRVEGSWVHWVGIGLVVVVVFLLVLLFMPGIHVLSLTTRLLMGLAMVSLLSVLMIPFTSTLTIKIVIDRDALRVRSTFGWPLITIRREKITTVEVVDYDTWNGFGRLGLVWGFGGRSGLVLFDGPAIEVNQTNGKCFVLSVRDAEAAAEALATVAKK